MTSSEDDDRRALRAATRSYLAHTLNAHGRPHEVDATSYDRAGWLRMAQELGLTGVRIAERFGGSGLGLAEEMLVHEEMGRVLFGGPYLATVAMAAIALQVAEHEDALARIAAGEFVVACALDDVLQNSGRGADAELSGTSEIVVDAAVADAILVRSDDALLLVDSAAAGVAIEPLHSVDLTRRFARVRFDRAPAEVVARDDLACDAVAAAKSNGYLALAAESVGAAARALEMTVDYVKVRHQFGRPIGSFQAVKHRCADMLVRLETARSALSFAVRAREAADGRGAAADGHGAAAALAVARAHCGEDPFWIANEAIHLHGGIGFTWEHAAHLYYRRAKSNQALLDPDGSQRRALAATVAAAYEREELA